MKGDKNKRFFVHLLPVYGTISTGLIYTAIGIIAILSFLQLKEGGADEGSLLAFMYDYLAGKIFVWVVLLGTLSYIIWRIFEAIRDPYNYGNTWRGISRRLGIGLSSIADIFIAYSALMVILGISDIREDGRPEEEREMVGSMLQEGWGDMAIISIGVIIMLTAVVQLYYGITRGYRERQDIAHFGKEIKKLIHFLGLFGYAARGIIIGIIGFFFIKAGTTDNPTFVVNTDKAFDFLGDHVGYLAFILIAIGTISYGFFMFFLGATYDPYNEKKKSEAD
ncbi:DUF1206 domain-containing protein [Antarcticibacterium arcticum]|uniref:DUF1206 domain-containing protein n=1 Tax=Antarcticibacterium arcticum TaxID=2585771 RepID=A0A5B8YHV3_9FLAO|nr:DUF1206 domain-containing protein [Antarcticibacterium arcticum]QED36417.1 DUF1206 domain-containing protein [Antarcticibacterium arcticum]